MRLRPNQPSTYAVAMEFPPMINLLRRELPGLLATEAFGIQLHDVVYADSDLNLRGVSTVMQHQVIATGMISMVMNVIKTWPDQTGLM